MPVIRKQAEIVERRQEEEHRRLVRMEEKRRRRKCTKTASLTFELVIVRQCHDATSHHLSDNHQQMDLNCCGFIIALICSTNAGGKEKMDW